jgi:hypothetical protein
MNNKLDNEEIVFSITVGDIQQESLRLIGRKLNDKELLTAIDGIDWGLSTDIFTVFRAAIDMAVAMNGTA